jgi:hypothetical protein
MSILRQILSGKPQPVTPQFGGNQRPMQNPFLQHQSLHPQVSMDDFGVNRPLRHPMFVGYKENKPIYAGSRLFVLY